MIAATNRDLVAGVAAGRFRQDLFYRLNVFPIAMPPLRSRKDDIPMLVEYFASRYAARLGKKLETIDRATMEQLVAYPWPGNVRELQNVIERAAILAEDGVLRVEEGDLHHHHHAPHATEERKAIHPHAGPAVSAGGLRGQEQQLIESALARVSRPDLRDPRRGREAWATADDARVDDQAPRHRQASVSPLRKRAGGLKCCR